ncbi:MAG: hypothetical protein ACRC46_01525 [Thermoguttaceae bacterium]
MTSPMESLKIVFFCVAAACVYGWSHDLVTAHICREYFLPPAHPVIIQTDSPLVLALVWGFVATWWFGLLLGVPLAIACRFGRKQPLTLAHVVRPVVCLLVVVYIAAMLLGCVGYVSGRLGWVWLLPPLADAVAPERHAAFLFDMWAHESAYILGGIGGLILVARCWCARGRCNIPTA